VNLAPPAGCFCMCPPEISVELADASVEPSKRGRGRPKKLAEAKIVVPPTVLENEKRVIIGEEARTEVLEEPDILADQHAMQCPDWARAHDTDLVIKRMKEVME